MKKSTYLTPLLDKVLEEIQSHLPIDAEAVEADLQAHGLALSAFRLEGIIRAAQLLGRKLPVKLDSIDGRRMALRPQGAKLPRLVIGIAKKAISRFGVTTTEDVAGLVEERKPGALTADAIARILAGQRGFEWLDQAGGWFWLRSHVRNRVVSRIRKILAITESIEVTDLRSGIARHHAMKGYAPPRGVLLELCRRLPDCKVEGTRIRAKPGLDWRNVLRGTELTMVQVLIEHGPVMRRAAFEDVCVGLGMKRSTFWVYLDYSPIIDRYASGVYGLRGATIDPVTVQSLIPQRQPPATVRLDHGWTEDHKVWISYRLSDAMITSGVFSVPSGLKQFLQGSHTLKAVDAKPFGALAVKDTAGWGLSPFFRRRGGEAGDTLLIVFDLNAREAIVSVGDEVLLEPYQTTASHADEATSTCGPTLEPGSDLTRAPPEEI